MTKINEWTSSQENTEASSLNNIEESIHGHFSHCLLEDLCLSFSIELSPRKESKNFYAIEPNNDLLHKFLSYNDFLNRSFDDILSTVMCSLVTKGVSYTEIVFYKDTDFNLIGIEFKPLNVYKARKKLNCTYFYARKHKKPLYGVLNNNLIFLDLKKIGYRRNFFLKIFSKLSKLEKKKYSFLRIPHGLPLILEKNFKRWLDFEFLKTNKKSFWDGRKPYNYFLNEPYSLYREANYKMIRYKFLDYILQEFNSSLERFSSKFSFNGRIVTTAIRINYQKHLKAFQDGEMNIEQLNTILTKNQD
ncbi:MAG: hypothetical protein PHX86_06145 [Caldisericia bacterium]|nr:hypothetical protein [Caldisericia bacterium]